MQMKQNNCDFVNPLNWRNFEILKMLKKNFEKTFKSQLKKIKNILEQQIKT